PTSPRFTAESNAELAAVPGNPTMIRCPSSRALDSCFAAPTVWGNGASAASASESHRPSDRLTRDALSKTIFDLLELGVRRLTGIKKGAPDHLGALGRGRDLCALRHSRSRLEMDARIARGRADTKVGSAHGRHRETHLGQTANAVRMRGPGVVDPSADAGCR